MEPPGASIANADQIEFWNGEAGDKWVRHQETQDIMLGPLGERSLSAARIAAGERVIDVGCGCGDTTLEIARRVGNGGQVLGIDVSEQMLEHARRRAAKEPGLTAEFLKADAASHSFKAGASDVVHSRFGVMFFANPEIAFGNLARALRPGGRLAFVCWRPVAENDWVNLPMQSAAEMIQLPPPPAPGTPGPFAFGDKTRVEGILAAGGFKNIDFAPDDRPMLIADSLAAGVEKIVDNSPLARVLVDIDAATRLRLIEKLTGLLAPYCDDRGLWLNGATWIVTAQT